MTVLVIAEDEKWREEVREAVLEALHNNGDCIMVSHEAGLVIFELLQPDLIVVCDYDEALTPPTTHSVGWRSYNRIKRFAHADHMIRMGKKYLRYSNYAQNLLSLKALVYMQH